MSNSQSRQLADDRLLERLQNFYQSLVTPVDGHTLIEGAVKIMTEKSDSSRDVTSNDGRVIDWEKADLTGYYQCEAILLQLVRRAGEYRNGYKEGLLILEQMWELGTSTKYSNVRIATQITVIERLLKIPSDENRPDFKRQIRLAGLFRLSGQMTKARELLQALAWNEDLMTGEHAPQLSLEIAAVHADEGNIVLARKHLEWYLTMVPKDQRAQMELKKYAARVYCRIGDFQAAARLFENALLLTQSIKKL